MNKEEIKVKKMMEKTERMLKERMNEIDNKISEFKASKLQNKEKESKSDAVTGEILYKRLTNIEKNLDRILSKFTKTTWLSHYLYN